MSFIFYLLLTGLFISLPAKDAIGQYNVYLLAFAPLLDQTALTAVNHRNFILSIMDDYKLSEQKLICLIGDNCSTNTATANQMGLPLLGCRSHRFNLAVEKYVDHYLKTEADKVGKLMSKLSTLKEAARLRIATPLRPVRRNVTRWLGVIKMFERYEKLQPSLHVSSQAIAEFVPTVSEQMNIKKYQQPLADFKAVTLTLQSQTMTMADSEELFQTIIAEYPDFNFGSML